jgi:hypothetical protein
MNTVLGLLIGSAAVGLVIGAKSCVFTMIGLAPVLAMVAAVAVRNVYVAPGAEIAFGYACLTVAEMAYLFSAWLSALSRPTVAAVDG